MRRQTHYVCLCCLLLLAACVGARFTYQDLSVPEDGIQGFSITQTFDDSDSWMDASASSDDATLVETYDSARLAGTDFSVSRLVDSLYDALFSPRMRTMDYMVTRNPIVTPTPRWGSQADDYVDRRALGPGDLYRQLSLARFAPQQYRVYVIPVAEDVVEDEPTMEQLLRELDEETNFLSSQLDDYTISSQGPFFGNSTLYGDATPTTPPMLDDRYDPISTQTYDASVSEPGYYEYEPTYDAIGYLTEPGADYTYADAYGDGGYYDSYDLALDPYEEQPQPDFSSDAAAFDTSDTFASNQLPAISRKRYEVFDELPHMPADASADRVWISSEPMSANHAWIHSEPMYEPAGCHGFWARLKPDGFSIWTAILCIACVGMWIYVFVEYRMNSSPTWSVFTRGSDEDDSDALSTSSDHKAPLLPLKGEFDGVEAADVYRAYWLKVQHARDHAAPANDDYSLKAFAQP